MKGVKHLKDEKGKDIVQMSLSRWNQILEYLEDAALVKEMLKTDEEDKTLISSTELKKAIKQHASNLSKKSNKRYTVNQK